MDSIRWFAAMLILMAISGAAIANGPNPPPGRIPMTVHAPHGVLPTIVYHTGHDTVEAYAAAIANPDILAAVPCTCGCMETIDHRNNLDCYVDEVLPDGTVAFSTHGLYCLICQWITRDAIEGAKNGLDADQLNELILERYGPHS
jgi:hypothetical protein